MLLLGQITHSSNVVSRSTRLDDSLTFIIILIPLSGIHLMVRAGPLFVDNFPALV